MPKRIYVISSREDPPEVRDPLAQALSDAGHELVDLLSPDVDGAVIVACPAALHSSKVIKATPRISSNCRRRTGSRSSPCSPTA